MTPESERRAALLARSKSLREKATAFYDRLKDAKAKDFMRHDGLQQHR
jgi:hypothetical protein